MWNGAAVLYFEILFWGLVITREISDSRQ